MNLYFTPSHRRGKEYQLFLPFTAVWKEEGVHSQENDISITAHRQVAMQLAKEQNESPEAIKEQQAKSLDKEKAKIMLQLDDKDIDDIMRVSEQQRILEEIKKNRKSHNNQQGSQVTVQNYPQQTNHHQHSNQQSNPSHPHNQRTIAENPHHAVPNVLQAGYMDPVCPPHDGGGGFQQPYYGDPQYGHIDFSYRPSIYAQHGGGAAGVDNLNPYNLEVGCMVQLGDRSGVIKWIDDATAGVEMVSINYYECHLACMHL